MKFKFKKGVSIFLATALLTVNCIQPIAIGSFSQAQLIYEEKTSENITSGVSHQTIRKFLTSGWLNINVLKIDLTNPYVKLDLLTSKDGISTLDDVKSMVTDSNAVAGINSDFFDKISLPNKTSSGYPLSFSMKSGNYVSSSFYEKNKFASFSMDSLKQILYSYVSNSIVLVAPNGTKIKASDINKMSANFRIPVVYNRYWGKYSIGSYDKFPNMLEMVVEDNVVTEMRACMPSTVIPENGFVVSACVDGASLLKSNFKVGDKVQLNVTTTPDMSSQDFAIGGDTLLVKNGKIASFSHNISGSNPRSALGTSKDGHYAYIAAVDGRQTISQGLTLADMANLMLNLGCYNAINFDGGGSTQMVAREPGTSTIGVVNSPCEIPYRKVADTLGIISTAPKGSLKGLIINSSGTNVFANTTRDFSVKGFDQYYNPINVDQSSVSWKISGVKGAFNGNALTATSTGQATVTASVNGVSQSIKMNVLGSPYEINISPRDIETTVGKTVNLKIVGKDKNGFSANIDASSLKWNNIDSIGTIAGNAFKATSQGSAVISGSIGKVTAYCHISASGESQFVAQPCETPTVTFRSYPADVLGAVYTSDEQKHSGTYSYKLTYDFSSTTDSRAAYMVFPDNSVNLAGNTTDIGLWVYNDAPKSEWLKAQIVDSSGSTHLIDLCKDLSWTGWKFIKVSLDADIPLPAQLSRIYVVQIDPAVSSSGTLYIDDITLFTSATGGTDSSVIPENVKLSDPAEKAVKVTSSASSFQFAVTGNIASPGTILDKLLIRKLKEKIKGTELVTLTGGVSSDFSKSIQSKKIVSANNKKSILKYKNSTFITLDDTKSSIRKTDASQWIWLTDKLSKIDTQNLFIVLPKPVDSDSFSDNYELELFQKILEDYQNSTKKNIWIISGGQIDKVDTENNIRNFTVSGLTKHANLSASLDKTKCLLVSVNGNEVTYQDENLY